MVPCDFRDFFIRGSGLVQQEIVNTLLSLSLEETQVKENNDVKIIICPHCSDKYIRANGKLKGAQGYVCNGCKKKDKLNRYLYCLLSGYSIRQSAKETGISIQTSFDWRHKLLTSFSSVSVDEFKGIV